MRVLGGAAVAAASVLMLTACGSQASRPTASPTVTVAPSTAAPAPTATVTRTLPATPEPATSTAAADPGRPANQCTDIGVSVVTASGGGAAGSEFFDVLFTNTGGTPCALRGTPGVSVVGDGDGTQLGEPATRVQTGVSTLTLAVGQTVAAPLQVVNIGTNGGPLQGCTVKRGDGYRVYPPHSTRAYFVQDSSAVACVSGPAFMTVRPVARYSG
ncbi:DUF4232 domain-containing protein [Amnibacterium sp.]|uniref:DUF4232 domain-containing protein n=1 Tax=Amnibacterium sp. TaxID=1872496 RepID=UPI003F7CA474